MKINTFVSKGIYAQYFHYFLPTTLSMVMYSLYCFADVFFVSVGVGSDGLAALNICLPIFTVFSALGMMIGVGTAVTCAIFQGSRDYDNSDRTFTISLCTTVILGVIITAVFYIFMPEILTFLGANEDVYELAREYMLPIGVGIVFNMLNCVLTIVVRCDGNPKLAMIAGLSGNFTNIFLDFIFVMPLGLQMFGAGLATAIGPVVGICILSLHFIAKENKVTFIKDFLKIKLLIKIFINGGSVAILEIATGVVTLLINRVLIKMAGADGVAIFSVISNIAFIGKNLFSGAAQAAQPMISRRYAQKHYNLLKQANRIAMLTGLVLGIISTVLMSVFAENMIVFFISNDENIIKEGVLAIRIFYSTFAIMGLNTILMYYFQSIEHSMVSTMLALLRGIILIAIFISILPAHFGTIGVWLCVPFAEGITFVIFFVVLLLFNFKLKSKRKFTKTEAALYV